MACENHSNEDDVWIENLDSEKIFVTNPILSQNHGENVVSSERSNLETNFDFSVDLSQYNWEHPVLREIFCTEKAPSIGQTNSCTNNNLDRNLAQSLESQGQEEDPSSPNPALGHIVQEDNGENPRPHSPIIVHPCRPKEYFLFSMTAPEPNRDDQRIILETSYYDCVTQKASSNLHKRFREYRKGSYSNARMLQFVFDYASRLRGKLCLYNEGLPIITRKVWVDFSGDGPVYGNTFSTAL